MKKPQTNASASQVEQLIAEGYGNPFNFTKKKFKEWVLIPIEYKESYELYIDEALEFARS